MSNYNDIMLDLETLSTEPNAAILSIGACEFNRKTAEIGRKFYRKISLESCFELGLEASASTICWWMTQDEAARKEAFSGKLDIKTGLQALNFWLHGRKPWAKKVPSPHFIWANSPAFDLTIIRNAFRKADVESLLPIYRNERDMRTLRDLCPDYEMPEFEGIAHNALHDAIYQARVVSALLDRISCEVY